MNELNRQAVSATLHCLTGCLIGEVLGMSIATYLDWSPGGRLALAITLAFIFGYGLSAYGITKAGVSVKQAVRVALIADTASIILMETVANLTLWLWPGALEAELDSLLYWASLAIAFAVAFVLTVPLNRRLISKGKGHATAHKYHHHE